MEIVKKKIRMSRQRSQAMNQITLEEDLKSRTVKQMSQESSSTVQKSG